MERIAFISGGTFIYWSSVILTLAVVTAIAAFAALYLHKGGNVAALCLMVPMSIAASLALSRLIHWYCRTDSYASLNSAMTDYSEGGYALMGAVIACLVIACLLRLVRISKNLPDMLDSLAIGGGMGIAVGRLASFFNTSDRGMLLPEDVGLPFAWQVTNAVSGVVENRLATFMLQAIITGVIVLALLVWLLVAEARKKPLRSGDIFLLFLAAYGGSQVVLDSTRYDSLFLRSNGFISIVQILGAVALGVALIWFSVRMVKPRGMNPWYFALWGAAVAALGLAGYMEYHVQRHGDQAVFAYSLMGSAIVVLIGLTVTLCLLGYPKTGDNNT